MTSFHFHANGDEGDGGGGSFEIINGHLLIFVVPVASQLLHFFRNLVRCDKHVLKLGGPRLDTNMTMFYLYSDIVKSC